MEQKTKEDEIWHQMMSGEPYDASNEYLRKKLAVTRCKLWEYNNLPPVAECQKLQILKSLLGRCGENIIINQPFRCDYGENILVGENFFANFNLTILDEALVRIGNNAFLGPNVSIYTPCHPLEVEARNRWIEWARPVTIGDNVWIGGSVTILPGVEIGDNCVIGAGSVVTKSIPSHTMAVGNPCRMVRELR